LEEISMPSQMTSGAKITRGIALRSIMIGSNWRRRRADALGRISALARANQVLTSFHKPRRNDVEAGKHPTVGQSLERFSS
jgi:hypothetical protein